MEKFIYHVNEANKYFKTADHLTYVTYSLLKDPKLLLTATKNLQKSIEHIIEAFLKLEQYKKNFTIPQNFESKYALFKSLCIKKHQLSNEMLKTIIEIKSLLDQHQECSVEFIRNQKFVICNNNYDNIKSLDLKVIKLYLCNIKQLLQKLNQSDKNV
ncbi:hypothetical protein J4436_01535 [Candidatus Woesearchaeota archaeon]|nr:hypothetical protein [Candidatus Woesearchaeota archaeon]